MALISNPLTYGAAIPHWSFIPAGSSPVRNSSVRRKGRSSNLDRNIRGWAHPTYYFSRCTLVQWNQVWLIVLTTIIYWLHDIASLNIFMYLIYFLSPMFFWPMILDVVRISPRRRSHTLPPQHAFGLVLHLNDGAVVSVEHEINEIQNITKSEISVMRVLMRITSATRTLVEMLKYEVSIRKHGEYPTEDPWTSIPSKQRLGWKWGKSRPAGKCCINGLSTML